MPINERDLLARAAVRGHFDPRTLVDQSSEQGEEELAFLAQRSTERQLGNNWLWMLDLDSRQQGLSYLPTKTPELRSFLQQNAPSSDDLIGRMFQRVLGAKSRKDALQEVRAATGRQLSTLSVDEQVGLFQVVATLLDAKASTHAWVDESAARDIRRSATIKDRSLAMDVLLPDSLRGRTLQRRFLKDFVVVGASLAGERTKGKIATTAAPTSAIPVAVVTGVGGIGKSALLTTVNRDLVRTRAATVIAFDFDSPALRQGNVIAMAMEFSRQLGLAEPAADAELSKSRVELRHVAVSPTLGSYETISTVMLATHSSWAAALAGRPILNHPIVLILDTFEEVLTISSERVRVISDWVEDLSNKVGFTRLSIIISGRAAEDIALPANEMHVCATIALGDLGMSAGKAKLRDMFRRFKVQHEDLIAQLVTVFGSNPLVLEVLARFCEGKSRSEILALLAGPAKKGGPPADPKLRAEFAQRFLYGRILERLPENIKPLARPGLVLRRVTPELIREVLAGPCHLEPIDDVGARTLFYELKRVAWLVQPGGSPDEALHRKDLRRLMLPLLLADQEANPVLRAAINWFSRFDDPDSRVEALYYRALNNDLLLDLLDTELLQLFVTLGSDVEDLPTALRARIKNTGGGTLTGEEVSSLPRGAQAEIFEKRAKVLVGEGLESAALGLDPRVLRPRLAVSGTLPAMTGGDLAASDAEIWNYQTSKSADAQSRFNTGQFLGLAPNAAPLLRHLFRELGTSELGYPRGKETGDALGHPAYLAALSSFTINREEVREELSKFLREQPAGRALGRSIAQGLDQGLNDGRGFACLALLCAHCVGLDLREIPGFDRVSLERVRWSGSTPQAGWRLTTLLAQYGLVSAADPSLDAFPLSSQGMTSIIVPETPSDVNSPRWNTTPPAFTENFQVYLESSDVLQKAMAEGQWPTTTGGLPQSLIVGMRRIASNAHLVVNFPQQRQKLPEEFGLGLVPELRGALRHELAELPFEQLKSLVLKFSQGASIWPHELTADRINRKELTRQIPPLVEAIDDSGQWPEVASLIGDRDQGVAVIARGLLALWSNIDGAHIEAIPS